MGEQPPLRVETPALNWDPADVSVPQLPAVAPGPDPMSTLIAAVVPELATALTTAVAETRAREERFAANLEAARTSYQTTDDAGGQEIRTVADTGLSPASTPAAASGGGGGASMGQFGQVLGTVTQTAGQAVQAPTQAMGMAAAAPQGLMQGVQQFAQVAGQSGDEGDDSAEELAAHDQERRDESLESGDEEGARPGGAGASSSADDSAPVQGTPWPREPGDAVNL